MSTNTKLAEALKWWLQDPNELADYDAWVSEGIDYARAALAAHDAEQAQEPVATVRVHKTGGNAGIAWTAVPTEDAPLLPDGANLYAAPVEQAAQAVPAGFVPAFVLRNVLLTLKHENKHGGAIRDTIWHSDGETLFDYIENSLAAFDAPAAPAPEAQAARTEADGEAYTEGYFDGVRDTEAKAQAAGQDEREAFEVWAKENRHGRISGEDEWDMDYPLGRCLWRAWQARAAVAQRQPLTEWQPIETAPKDGTLLLLWEEYESEPFIGSWHAFRSEWEASRTYYDTDGNECVVDRVYSPGVTHWMPLPAAPGATTGEQQQR